MKSQTSKTFFSSRFPLEQRPAGIGLRAPYYKELLETRPDIGWLEIHPENYFGGGVHRHYLTKLRELYPLSMHAVGLSLGSCELPDKKHLDNIKELIDIYEPFQVSDHASWSASGNAHLNDLLPLPYTLESLQTLCRNIEYTQEILGQRIVVENPSTYIAFKDNDMSEPDFMNALAERTGCGILLDINNIFVQCTNNELDPYNYINSINRMFVEEFHLAGHSKMDFGDASLLIDTHNSPVCEEVWKLFQFTVKSTGQIPTLIEWDQDYPPLSVIIEQAKRAESIIRSESLHAAA